MTMRVLLGALAVFSQRSARVLSLGLALGGAACFDPDPEPDPAPGAATDGGTTGNTSDATTGRPEPASGRR